MKKVIKIGNTDFTELKDKIEGWTAEEILKVYKHLHPKIVAEFVKQFPAKTKVATKKANDKKEKSND